MAVRGLDGTGLAPNREENVKASPAYLTFCAEYIINIVTTAGKMASDATSMTEAETKEPLLMKVREVKKLTKLNIRKLRPWHHSPITSWE